MDESVEEFVERYIDSNQMMAKDFSDKPVVLMSHTLDTNWIQNHSNYGMF